MITERRFLLGVDLAKAFDFTSFAAIEMTVSKEEGKVSEGHYSLRGLERIQGQEYPAIEAGILSMYEQLEEDTEVTDGPHLCLDASGLGGTIRDYLKHHRVFTKRKQIYPVVFTGGDKARTDPETGNYNISKTLMVTNFLSLQQHHQFEYAAADLGEITQFKSEIATFKQHMTSGGNVTFNAEIGAHDDLICAVMIPLIIGQWHFMTRKVYHIIAPRDEFGNIEVACGPVREYPW